MYASHYHPGFAVWSSMHMTVSPALFCHFKCELLVVHTFGRVIPAMYFGPAMVVCSPRWTRCVRSVSLLSASAFYICSGYGDAGDIIVCPGDQCFTCLVGLCLLLLLCDGVVVHGWKTMFGYVCMLPTRTLYFSIRFTLALLATSSTAIWLFIGTGKCLVMRI